MPTRGECLLSVPRSMAFCDFGAVNTVQRACPSSTLRREPPVVCGNKLLVPGWYGHAMDRHHLYPTLWLTSPPHFVASNFLYRGRNTCIRSMDCWGWSVQYCYRPCSQHQLSWRRTANLFKSLPALEREGIRPVACGHLRQGAPRRRQLNNCAAHSPATRSDWAAHGLAGGRCQWFVRAILGGRHARAPPLYLHQRRRAAGRFHEVLNFRRGER